LGLGHPRRGSFFYFFFLKDDKNFAASFIRIIEKEKTLHLKQILMPAHQPPPAQNNKAPQPEWPGGGVATGDPGPPWRHEED